MEKKKNTGKMEVSNGFCFQKALVGGFNPHKKNERQNGFIFPNFRAENKTKRFWVASTQIKLDCGG